MFLSPRNCRFDDMIATNNKLLVRFEEKHNKFFKLGDIELIRAETWVHRDQDEDNPSTSLEENTNGLETRPQIATVVAHNPDYPYVVGDRIWLHYMAYETGEESGLNDGTSFINVEYVFCTLLPDNTFRMAKDIYFGKEVLTTDEKTASGIIINPFGGRPKSCQIELTHAPTELSEKWETPHEPGATVITIDNNQYPSMIDEEKYIMLRHREIIGIYA